MSMKRRLAALLALLALDFCDSVRLTTEKGDLITTENGEEEIMGTQYGIQLGNLQEAAADEEAVRVGKLADGAEEDRLRYGNELGSPEEAAADEETARAGEFEYEELDGDDEDRLRYGNELESPEEAAADEEAARAAELAAELDSDDEERLGSGDPLDNPQDAAANEEAARADELADGDEDRSRYGDEVQSTHQSAEDEDLVRAAEATDEDDEEETDDAGADAQDAEENNDETPPLETAADKAEVAAAKKPNSRDWSSKPRFMKMIVGGICCALLAGVSYHLLTGSGDAQS